MSQRMFVLLCLMSFGSSVKASHDFQSLSTDMQAHVLSFQAEPMDILFLNKRLYSKISQTKPWAFKDALFQAEIEKSVADEKVLSHSVLVDTITPNDIVWLFRRVLYVLNVSKTQKLKDKCTTLLRFYAQHPRFSPEDALNALERCPQITKLGIRVLRRHRLNVEQS